MVDALFTPRNCVIYSTPVAEMVRDRRRIFLHKGCWHKFKGYAYSQLAKMKSQNRTGKRAEAIAEYGFDTKFAYHVVRLLDEVEQILTLGDIDLTRANEQMKAIRRGDVPREDIEKLFTEKERQLEKVYQESTLPYSPRESEIKELLLQCLEEHYGSLEGVVVRQGSLIVCLRQIEDLCRNALARIVADEVDAQITEGSDQCSN
jgi:hypothetical protein